MLSKTNDLVILCSFPLSFCFWQFATKTYLVLLVFQRTLWKQHFFVNTVSKCNLSIFLKKNIIFITGYWLKFKFEPLKPGFRSVLGLILSSYKDLGGRLAMVFKWIKMIQHLRTSQVLKELANKLRLLQLCKFGFTSTDLKIKSETCSYQSNTYVVASSCVLNVSPNFRAWPLKFNPSWVPWQIFSLVAIYHI